MSGEDAYERVIAFEIRSSRVGYAIFERPERLLDWGIKSFRSGVNAVRVPFAIKVANLLLDWQPNLILLKKVKVGRLPEKARIIEELAAPIGIKIRFVDWSALINAFPSALNKYDR